MTTAEPTPTGYLNVFEYNLSANINLGDQVCIQNLQPSTTVSRYSLAYLRNPPKPLVHIEVMSNNNQFESTTPPSIKTSTPPKVNSGIAAAITVRTSTGKPAANKTEPVIPISIGTLCFLVVLAAVFVGVFVTCRYVRNTCTLSTTPNNVLHTEKTEDDYGIEMDINQAYVTSTVQTERNIAYDLPQGLTKHKYDYVYL